MGFFDFNIGDVFGLVSTGISAYAEYKSIEATKQIAEDRRDLQIREAQRVQAIETARAKREARVRQAQLLASQGNAGAVTSTATEGTIGIDSSLAGGLSDLRGQTAGQIAQFNLAASATKKQATIDTFALLGNFLAADSVQDFAGGVSDFTSGLFANASESQAASVGTLGRTDLATRNTSNIA